MLFAAAQPARVLGSRGHGFEFEKTEFVSGPSIATGSSISSRSVRVASSQPWPDICAEFVSGGPCNLFHVKAKIVIRLMIIDHYWRGHPLRAFDMLQFWHTS